eukprot:g52248.t1
MFIWLDLVLDLKVRLEVLRETIFHVLDALESLHIKNRYVFINNRSGEKGGGQVFIVHKKFGPVSRFAVNSFIDKSQLRYLEDTQWILIKHLNLVVGNIYLRPTKRQGGGFKSQLKALQSVVSGVAQSANYNIILLGDFNFQVSATKTNLFDCDLKYIDHESSGQVSGGMVRKIPNPHRNTTSQADEFVRNLESVPLLLLTGLLGEADYTFCAAKGNDSLLDYCFCSPTLVRDVDNYVTWPQYFIAFSDHKLITVDVKMQKSNSTIAEMKANPRKAWAILRRFLGKESDSPRQIENDGGEVVGGKEAATVFAEQYHKQLNRPSNLPAPPTHTCKCECS